MTEEDSFEKIIRQQDLLWDNKDKLPNHWYEGSFTGNGRMGTLVYFQENPARIHVELGRNDVYDTRETRDFWMAKQFDNPRLPIGSFSYELTGEIRQFAMQLNLYDAMTELYIETDDEVIETQIYTASKDDIIVIRQLKGSLEKWRFTPARAVSPRQTYALLMDDPSRTDKDYIENKAPCLLNKDGIQYCVQELAGGWKTVTGYMYAQSEQTVLIHIDQGRDYHEEQAGRYLKGIGIKEMEKRHKAWWHSYYKISRLAIPDKRLLKFYWVQIYKMACAVREHTHIMDNQGPWLYVTPWPGTWWNLNVQLCYWPSYTANRLCISRSLNNYLLRHMEDLIENVPEEFRYDSAGIGTNTTRGLKSRIADPGKDNGLQFVELGNLTWTLHNCWLYYQMTLDKEILSRLVYPLLRRSVNYYLHFLFKGEDGCWHLPKTASPEYGELCEDCCYDLSLLKWGVKTLGEIVCILGIEDEKEEIWKDVYDNLAEYPVNENGYMIGKALPYEKSHRHFSHLMMHMPLYLENRDNGGDKKLIEKSVEWWHSIKGDIEGFSNVGASLIYSAYREGDKALYYLNRLWDGYITENTMYKEAGPVLETPLAAAECIQQMLLQSFGGKVRVFPAVPKEWNSASFVNFAAQGGFCVSAVYEGGKTAEIEISSRETGDCIVETDIRKALIWYDNGEQTETVIEGEIKLKIKAGQSLKIKALQGSAM